MPGINKINSNICDPSSCEQSYVHKINQRGIFSKLNMNEILKNILLLD